MNNRYTYVIEAGKLAWPKIKSVLVHALLVGLAALAVGLEQLVLKTNFGGYQAVVLIVNTTVFKFVQKWFTDQGVVVPEQ